MATVWARLFAERAESGDVAIFANDGGALVPAHRCVLAAASTAWRTYLAMQLDTLPAHGSAYAAPDSSEMRATRVARLPRLTIVGVDTATLRGVVRFIYTGRLPLDGANAVSLLLASERLALAALRSAAEYMLPRVLRDDNCCGVLAVAAAHRAYSLVSLAGSYVLRHFDAIVESPSWSTIPRSILGALLASDELCTTSETRVLQSAFKWALSNLALGSGALATAASELPASALLIESIDARSVEIAIGAYVGVLRAGGTPGSVSEAEEDADALLPPLPHVALPGMRALLDDVFPALRLSRLPLAVLRCRAVSELVPPQLTLAALFEKLSGGEVPPSHLQQQQQRQSVRSSKALDGSGMLSSNSSVSSTSVAGVDAATAAEASARGVGGGSSRVVGRVGMNQPQQYQGASVRAYLGSTDYPSSYAAGGGGGGDAPPYFYVPPEPPHHTGSGVDASYGGGGGGGGMLPPSLHIPSARGGVSSRNGSGSSNLFGGISLLNSGAAPSPSSSSSSSAHALFAETGGAAADAAASSYFVTARTERSIAESISSSSHSARQAAPAAAHMSFVQQQLWRQQRTLDASEAARVAAVLMSSSSPSGGAGALADGGGTAQAAYDAYVVTARGGARPHLKARRRRYGNMRCDPYLTHALLMAHGSPHAPTSGGGVDHTSVSARSLVDALPLVHAHFDVQQSAANAVLVSNAGRSVALVEHDAWFWCSSAASLGGQYGPVAAAAARAAERTPVLTLSLLPNARFLTSSSGGGGGGGGRDDGGWGSGGGGSGDGEAPPPHAVFLPCLPAVRIPSPDTAGTWSALSNRIGIALPPPSTYHQQHHPTTTTTAGATGGTGAPLSPDSTRVLPVGAPLTLTFVCEDSRALFAFDPESKVVAEHAAAWESEAAFADAAASMNVALGPIPLPPFDMAICLITASEHEQHHGGGSSEQHPAEALPEPEGSPQCLWMLTNTGHLLARQPPITAASPHDGGSGEVSVLDPSLLASVPALEMGPLRHLCSGLPWGVSSCITVCIDSNTTSIGCTVSNTRHSFGGAAGVAVGGAASVHDSSRSRGGFKGWVGGGDDDDETEAEEDDGESVSSRPPTLPDSLPDSLLVGPRPGPHPFALLPLALLEHPASAPGTGHLGGRHHSHHHDTPQSSLPPRSDAPHVRTLHDDHPTAASARIHAAICRLPLAPVAACARAVQLAVLVRGSAGVTMTLLPPGETD